MLFMKNFFLKRVFYPKIYIFAPYLFDYKYVKNKNH